MNLTKIRNLAGVALLASLAACSGTGSCPPNGSNGELSLKIEAPAQYPAGLPESINAVLTMTNTSTIDANNLKYTVPAPGEAGNYTGVTIIPNAGIDSAAESCINIKAGASCTFTATIGAYANPGSFTVTATPNSSKSSVKQALNKLLGTNSISVTANLGLVDIPDFPSYFYILPDMQTITSNSNGSTTVMLSLLVKDAPENLDNIVLVDGEESSIVLDAKPVVTPSYTVNSVNTYQVTIPAGTDIQKVRAIGYANNIPQCTFRVPTGLGYYAICSNTATINLVGTGTGILSVQPTYVNMNESYESQIVTLTNIGTGAVSNITYPNWTALAESQFSIANNTCGATLAIGASCQFKLTYLPNSNSGVAEPVFNYYNGVTNESAGMTIPYVGVIPPQLTSVSPINGATDVSLITSISVTFDEPMDVATLIPSNFAVQKLSDSSPVTLVSPIYSADHKTVTFATSSGTANPALISSTQYKVIIPNPANVKSADGTSLGLSTVTYPDGVVSTFTTATVQQCSPVGGGWAGVMNSTNNSFTKCYWQDDGSLYGCSGNGTNVPLFNNPSVILFDGYGSLYAANAGDNNLAYYLGALYTGTFAAPSPLFNLTAPAISGARVAFNISKGFVFVNTTGGLNVCGINTGTGALTGCSESNPIGLSVDAYGSAFSSNGTSNGIFWTANKDANTISSCPATDDNPTVITQCNDAASNDITVGAYLNKPSAIYATDAYVLITNDGNNTIVRCEQSNGQLSNCTYTGGNINGPRAIVSGNAPSSNFIYITNQTDNSVTVCKNSGGILTDCNRMIYPNAFTSPTGIFVNDACGAG